MRRKITAKFGSSSADRDDSEGGENGRTGRGWREMGQKCDHLINMCMVEYKLVWGLELLYLVHIPIIRGDSLTTGTNL